MTIDKKVSITISIEKEYRNQLRAAAAKRNLHDPDQLATASSIVREIVIEHLDELERMEANFVGDHSGIATELESGLSDDSVAEKMEG